MAQNETGIRNLENQIKKLNVLKNETNDPVLRVIYTIMLNTNIRKYNTRLYTELYMTREERRAVEESYGRVDRDNDKVLKGNPALQSLIEAFRTGEMSADGIIDTVKHIDFHPLNGEIQIYKLYGYKNFAA